MGIMDYMGRQDGNGDFIVQRMLDEQIRDLASTIDVDHPTVWLRLRPDTVPKGKAPQMSGEMKTLHAVYLEQLEQGDTIEVPVWSQQTQDKYGRRKLKISFATVGHEPTQIAHRSARVILREVGVLVEEHDPSEDAAPDVEEADDAEPKTEKKPAAPSRRRRP